MSAAGQGPNKPLKPVKALARPRFPARLDELLPQAAKPSGSKIKARRLSNDIDDPPWYNDDFFHGGPRKKFDHIWVS